MHGRRSILALVAALGLLLTLVTATTSASATRVYRLTLTGAQEATPTCEPSPTVVCGDPDAVAAMILIVNPNNDRVCFLTRWTNIDGTVTAAHIHLAPVGDPGPVVVPLFAGAFAGTDMLRGCVSAAGLAAAINANPAAYYVNIHSTVFPGGAVRAQLG